MRLSLGIPAAALTSLAVAFAFLSAFTMRLGISTYAAYVLSVPALLAFALYHGLSVLAVRAVPAHPAVVLGALALLTGLLCALPALRTAAPSIPDPVVPGPKEVAAIVLLATVVSLAVGAAALYAVSLRGPLAGGGSGAGSGL